MLCFVKYVIIVDVDARVVIVVSRLMVMIVDGGVAVLKDVVYVVWFNLWWVWLERCRDGRYVVNALRCDVWVVWACLPVCIVACFVGFWGNVFLFLVSPLLINLLLSLLISLVLIIIVI